MPGIFGTEDYRPDDSAGGGGGLDLTSLGSFFNQLGTSFQTSYRTVAGSGQNQVPYQKQNQLPQSSAVRQVAGSFSQYIPLIAVGIGVVFLIKYLQKPAAA